VHYGQQVNGVSEADERDRLERARQHRAQRLHVALALTDLGGQERAQLGDPLGGETTSFLLVDLGG
jgi:hypothetical protein